MTTVDDDDSGAEGPPNAATGGDGAEDAPPIPKDRLSTLRREELTALADDLESRIERSTYRWHRHPPGAAAEEGTELRRVGVVGTDTEEVDEQEGEDDVKSMLEELADVYEQIVEVEEIEDRNRGVPPRRGCAAADNDDDNSDDWDDWDEKEDGSISVGDADTDSDDDGPGGRLSDSLLDWAIASKRAGRKEGCVLAHLRRMSLSSECASVDAVRLLGLKGDGPRIRGSGHSLHFEDDGWECEVKERPSGELFEAIQCRLGDEEDEGSSGVAYGSTENARAQGVKVQSVFERRGYALRRCRSFLDPHIEAAEGGEVGEDRIFSGNSFFNHRREVYREWEGGGWMRQSMDGLEVLTNLFLFGLGMPLREVVDALGAEDVDVLRAAGVLRDCPPSGSGFVVGEVQVYPLGRSDLCSYGGGGIAGADDNGHDPQVDRGPTYLFMTDWPMESLRSNRDAVMPVGYDTLELLALSAAPVSSKSGDGGRLLDMCCGCGIQGIFAWRCASEDDEQAYDKLLAVDVNERACRFAAANVALNGIIHGTGCRPQDEGGDVAVVCGDLYEPLREKGTYSRIISNPPFVAVPSRAVVPHLNPALYAAGGGVDGMEVLRCILGGCFDFLAADRSSDLLMVTEVPNVEDSCELLRGCLSPHLRDNARIRVAYVEADVETAEDYSREREAEAGGSAIPGNRDWAAPMREEHIYNRALVLISISRVREGDSMSRLDKYVGPDSDARPWSEDRSGSADADEEDAFLTAHGIAFARNSMFAYQ